MPDYLLYSSDQARHIEKGEYFPAADDDAAQARALELAGSHPWELLSGTRRVADAEELRRQA